MAPYGDPTGAHRIGRSDLSSTVYTLPIPLLYLFTHGFFLNMCTNHIEKMTEFLNFPYYTHQGSTTQADGKHFCEACGTVIHSQSLPHTIIPKVIFY